MKSKLPIVIVALALVVFILVVGAAPRGSTPIESTGNMENMSANGEGRFAYLSTHGNSACSLNFQNGIPAMADEERIQGSCCSPMSLHRYEEQIEAIKKYKDISEIPPDPYDVSGDIAKKMYAYYDTPLSPDEQVAYDYAMAHSHEKGPCCCKCWHWIVYGGLGKFLIHEKGFTGEQVTEVWDLSDACGGDEEHNHA